jgi:hypothetical protein
VIISYITMPYSPMFTLRSKASAIRLIDRSVGGPSPCGSPAGTGRFRAIESDFGTQFFLLVSPLPCTRSKHSNYYRTIAIA